MIIMAFDSSSIYLHAGLYQVPGKLKVSQVQPIASNSSALMDFLAGMCAKHKVPPKKITHLVVGLGPGSFTGLRMAWITAQTLHLSLGVRVCGISSLMAMAFTAQKTGKGSRIAVKLDAKKGLFYTAIYDFPGPVVKEILAPCLKPEAFFTVRRLKNSFCVDDQNKDNYPPGAEALLELGLHQVDSKHFLSHTQMQPNYLHAKDCNVQKKKHVRP